jgi:murein DD-endopeptidase MepM/ murein hydrolase activator NlpD
LQRNRQDTPLCPKTRFAKRLIVANGLDKSGLRMWAFYPGMLFDGSDTWCGNPGKRARPHQGLDLCLYKDRLDRIQCVEAGTQIPAMYDGLVVNIYDDFLGMSIIVDHGPLNGDHSRLCTIFGHTCPDPGLHVGAGVKEGDVIATIADARATASGVSSHLHISVGWKPDGSPYHQLDWGSIGEPNTLTLLDPLQVMALRYTMLERQNGNGNPT